MTRKHLIVILLVTIIPRLLVSWFVKDFTPSTWEYETLAISMMESGEYSMEYREYGEYKALLAPGYTFLTFAVYSVFGKSHLLMLLIQYALIFAAAVAIYKIAIEFFDKKRIALTASLIFTLHPGILHYSSNNLHQLCLYIPLFYWSVYFLIKCYQSGEIKYFIFLGLTGGCAMLTRATILPVICLSLLVILFLKRKDFKSVFVKSTAALVILLAVNIPWAVRNYNLFDKVIFSQTNKWESFWVGNNIFASGGHWIKEGSMVLSKKPPEMQKEINESDSEIKDNQIFKKYSKIYVNENPGHFIKGVLYKGVYFWWFHPQTGMLYPAKIVIIGKSLYILLLGLCLGGIYISWKEKLFKKEMLFPAFLVLGIWAVHSIYFMEMRHRWTVEPVMMLFAALAITKLKWFSGGKEDDKTDSAGSEPIPEMPLQ